MNYSELTNLLESKDKPKLVGIYYISIPEIGAYYIGESLDVFERFREHTEDLINGTHHNKLLQSLYNHGYDLKFHCPKSCKWEYGHNTFFKILNLKLEHKLIEKLRPIVWICNKENSLDRLLGDEWLSQIYELFEEQNIKSYEDILLFNEEQDWLWETFKEKFYGKQNLK